MSLVFRCSYATAVSVPFELATLAGDDFKTGLTFAVGDVTISKDGGAEANVTTLPSTNGTGYLLPLSATETTCGRAVVYVRDKATPQKWLARAIVIKI